MAWEVALIGSLVFVILGLFYLVGIFDSKEHAMFKLFLFFIGVFLIPLVFNIDSNIIIANNATINATNPTAYTRLGSNIDTAYSTTMWIIWVSLMYWFIYFIRKGLELFKFKKKKEIEGDEEEGL